MNKKGDASFSAWTTGILLILLLVALVSTQILDPMNTTYNQTFSTGINTSAINNFEETRQIADAKISNSTVEQTDGGLSLTEVWSIGKITYNTLVSVLTGGFVENLLVNILGFPAIVGTVVRIIFLLSLIFIIIYLFMKVKP